MAQLNLKKNYILGTLIFLLFRAPETFGMDETNQNQCGGPLEGDIGSLTYPIPGQTVQPGELCVWTINLQTTKTFTFDLSSLNINSTSECADGSVRIYSLTNLVATDKLESYTLCNENPTPGNLFISENVAAIVFHAGSNPGLETGFTLNWEGIAFNPIPTTHFNSYSTTPSGLIRFPVEGEYEPNTIATWLVKAGQIDEEINVDLNLTSLSVETCQNADPCVCDALILYEITDQGVLTESERFCGERSSAVMGGISANFILAFYSDFNSVADSGNGFEVIYKPSANNETTTTTVKPQPDVPCGTVITAIVDPNGSPIEGQIVYKPDEYHEPNARCVWTIRGHLSNMQFQLDQAGFTNNTDRVVIDLFSYAGNGTNGFLADPHLATLYLTSDLVGSTRAYNASTAIITFTTSDSNLGKGFILSYKISGMECNAILPELCPDLVTFDVIRAEPQGTITQVNDTIRDFMLSTYVLPPVNFQLTSLKKTIGVKYSNIEDNPSGCRDALWLYTFTYHSGLINVNKFCGNNKDWAFDSDDIMVFIFKSDQSIISEGFEIRWELRD